MLGLSSILGYRRSVLSFSPLFRFSLFPFSVSPNETAAIAPSHHVRYLYIWQCGDSGDSGEEISLRMSGRAS